MMHILQWHCEHVSCHMSSRKVYHLNFLFHNLVISEEVSQNDVPCMFTA